MKPEVLRSWTLFAVVSIGVGCTSAGPPASATPSSMQLPAPARGIHLRAAFDSDPSVYIGRFLPESLKFEEIDENAAAVTRCSKFVKARVVDVSQDVDEMMYASRSVAMSLGLPQALPVSLGAGRSDAEALRVRYRIAKKIQSDVDAEGLSQCCSEDPSQCSGKMIGEFVMGSGSILRSATSQRDVGMTTPMPQGARVGASAASDDQWHVVTTFQDTFFAFLTTATSMALTNAATATPGADRDCSWCENPPRSLDGKYFCGISPDAPNDSLARDLAMRNAREQVVKYAGESLIAGGFSHSSAARGLADDEQFVKAAAQGTAARVKDQKWCRAERVGTPSGERVRAKVLVFVARADLEAIASQVSSGAPGSSASPPSRPAPESRPVPAP